MKDLKTYEELIKSSDLLIAKPTKEALKEILKWTSSRYNEYKKNEAINIILDAIENDEDIVEEFIAGTFTEMNGFGTHYIFIKHKNEAYLIEKGKLNQLVYKLM